MGVGINFAIGAQFAFPNHLVICVDGDGSFNMTCNELYSVAKYKLPIKVSLHPFFPREMGNHFASLCAASVFIRFPTLCVVVLLHICICNDSRQQMVYIWQKLFFDKV